MNYKGSSSSRALILLFLCCCISAALVTLSFVMDDYGNIEIVTAFADLDQDRFSAAVIGLATFVLFAVMFIIVFLSVRYQLNEEYLRIKGFKFMGRMRWVDKEIYYKDIMGTSVYRHGRKERINILYWTGKSADIIDISAPALHKRDSFIKTLADKVRQSDFSHIISQELLDSRHGGVLYIDSLDVGLLIEIEKCTFLDENRLLPGTTFALIEDKGRVLLLGNCHSINLDKITSTMPPKIENISYILCPYAFLMHTNYWTAKEAIADVRFHRGLNKDARAIDAIAYDRHQIISTGLMGLVPQGIAEDFFK